MEPIAKLIAGGAQALIVLGFCIATLFFVSFKSCDYHPGASFQQEQPDDPLYATAAFDSYQQPSVSPKLQRMRSENDRLREEVNRLENNLDYTQSEFDQVRARNKKLHQQLMDLEESKQGVEQELQDSIIELKRCRALFAELEGMYLDLKWEYDLLQDTLQNVRHQNQLLQREIDKEREVAAIARRSAGTYLGVLILLVTCIIVLTLCWYAGRKGWLPDGSKHPWLSRLFAISLKSEVSEPV